MKRGHLSHTQSLRTKNLVGLYFRFTYFRSSVVTLRPVGSGGPRSRSATPTVEEDSPVFDEGLCQSKLKDNIR